ncbi:6-phosphogluconolactonase [Nocardia sp. CNY236]|uniref:6-phosphogluconolactonase n=1 Tax=Nocardia sp. CNY236 TaxID=1169152 RepID=UPI0003F60EC6|nr:6-phosphogluconolactonase [Nocardia sp. CNY236]
MRPTVFADPNQLGAALAARITAEVATARSSDRPYVLGCPTGRSPASTYAALAARRPYVEHVVIVMMDEFVVGGREIDPHMSHSCLRYAREVIAGPLGIPDERVWLPDPAAPAAYDDRIAAVGGIDLFLLASGATDGHVAFNPPGTPADSITRVVELAETTRRDNMSTFPALRRLDDVPRHGVTVGIDTIRRHSRSAVMIAHGTQKATTVEHLVEAQCYDEWWPASIIAECANAELWIDEATLESPLGRI